MRLTEMERTELKALARAADDKSLDRFCELLAKEALPDDTYLNVTVLRESIKRAFPDYTEAQLDIFLRGRFYDLRESPSPDWWPNYIEELAVAVKALHPEMSDDEVAAWVKRNKERALGNKGQGWKSASAVVMALDQEDKEKAAAEELPNGLKELHPNWSQSQIDGWIKKKGDLAKTFKALHPEWNTKAIIIATDPQENI